MLGRIATKAQRTASEHHTDPTTSLSRQDANNAPVVYPGTVRSSRRARTAQGLLGYRRQANNLRSSVHAARATSHILAPVVSCRSPGGGHHPRWLRRGLAKRAGVCVCTANHKRRYRQIRCSAPQGTAWLSPRDLRVPHTTCVHTLLPANHIRSTQRCHVCSANNHLWARARVRHRCLPTHPPGSRRQPC